MQQRQLKSSLDNFRFQSATHLYCLVEVYKHYLDTTQSYLFRLILKQLLLIFEAKSEKSKNVS